MYICASCGAEFEGKVCPRCCTMRPSAAIINGSGSILKKPNDSDITPGRRATRLAKELEYSRQQDAMRQAEQAAAEQQQQTAVNWVRKAPGTRSGENDEQEDIVVPDALRSLKISPASAKGRDSSEKKKGSGWTPPPPASAGLSSWVRQVVDGSVPGGQIPEKKNASKEKTPNADRIDAAWRAFAKDRKGGGQQ